MHNRIRPCDSNEISLNFYDLPDALKRESEVTDKPMSYFEEWVGENPLVEIIQNKDGVVITASACIDHNERTINFRIMRWFSEDYKHKSVDEEFDMPLPQVSEKKHSIKVQDKRYASTLLRLIVQSMSYGKNYLD